MTVAGGFYLGTIPSRCILLVATYLLLAGWVAKADKRHFAGEAIDAELLCEGQLAEHAACQCRQVEGDISCINAQFVDTNIFVDIAKNYKSLQSVTFHGNNFQDLPQDPLFGRGTHDFLLRLNISANYIVNLNPNALRGMPNLQILDMSNNEIVLKPSDVEFLSHTPALTQLYLRRAFTSTVNRTIQFNQMLEMFQKAKLNNLQVLDLSYNYLQSVPYGLACPFPSLHTLDLRQNFLKSFDVNVTCIKNLHTINLNRNSFHTIPTSFQKMADSLAPQTFLMRNPLYCDCESHEYIAWIRSTNALRDRNSLVCSRASPKNYEGVRAMEVQVEKLTCNERFIKSCHQMNLPLFVFFLIVSFIF
ncbi:unnamed protein product [Caenorhabditis auriculariae]|uniref:LRRCT domain-containing protein n=1 Tax=Caenorhabditis auriculariae TaxID=2777116 RepID=A0A8S1H171_9PELO|nr:unnamed protein product [Caenorhabditis auriculariae]